MFVQTNSVSSIKNYFKSKLKDKFSENEIKLIVKESVILRLNITSTDFLLSDDQLLSESDLLYFRGIVKRLLNDEPFQYILGKTEFFGLELKIDSRALIPRPETEELVEWITQGFSQLSELNIIDLCTGSGCIGLALKSYFHNAHLLLTDLSEPALELAIENAFILRMGVETKLFDATLSSNYSLLKPLSFDICVSNPPYVPFSDHLKMEKNVLDFEPHMALFVENEDPLLFYRSISENALIILKPKGYVFFEIHEDLSNETVQLLKEIGFVNIELRKDLQGKDRMLKAQKP